MTDLVGENILFNFGNFKLDYYCLSRVNEE